MRGMVDPSVGAGDRDTGWIRRRLPQEIKRGMTAGQGGMVPVDQTRRDVPADGRRGRVSAGCAGYKRVRRRFLGRRHGIRRGRVPVGASLGMTLSVGHVGLPVGEGSRARPAPARDEGVPDADALPALRRRGREARGRGDASLPEPRLPLRGLETLINWVSAAMDIEGVGEQFVRRLWDLGLLRSMPDLYRLEKEQLLELDGFQERSASNVLASIEASKVQPFSRVLFGLNIPDVGWVTALNLARHFGTIDRLRAAPQEEIQEVEGIGPERAEAIANWFADEQNRALVHELRELGLQLEVSEAERPVEGPLTGSQYVITGTLRTTRARRRGQRSRRSAPR